MTLPRDAAGVIITSAGLGYSFLVQVEYNTDTDGKWVDIGDDHPHTLHGPFTSESEAQEWMDAYPDDTDVYDMVVVTVNNVRP